MPKIRYELDSDELNNLQYTVVVETMINGLSGKFKREFKKEFTDYDNDLAKARYWYNIFYRWYLVKGTPQSHTFSFETLAFIKKLIAFCGGL